MNETQRGWQEDGHWRCERRSGDPDPAMSEQASSLKKGCPMKTKAVIWLLCIAAVLVWAGIAYAQTAPTEPERIKALLLRPAGWKADWSLPGGYDKGEGEWIFEARGDKVVVKIQNFTRPTTCERDVTLTSDGVKFDGCRDLDITLRFDPNDLDYPFKGKSLSGTEYKGKAK